MIGVVDYGGGNVQSVRNALKLLQAPFQEISSPEHFKGVTALLFPGQGAFGDSMNGLAQRGLVDPLREWIQADRPFFGICIGYQVLFESSEENPGVAGLGVLPGRVVRFQPHAGMKIPHMGWNRAKIVGEASPNWDGLGSDPFFYFVHSYYPQPGNASVVATETEYAGVTFASSVQRGQMLATQFHPEKSQENGLRLMKNFVLRNLV